MTSLSPAWHGSALNHRLATIAGAGSGDRVLDLGCGKGNGIDVLLGLVGADGRVIGVDRDAAALAGARQRHAESFDACRLRLVRADITRPLPFADNSFDLVVCQNILECVWEPEELIEETRRVLRCNGRLALGHHDFASVALASSDRNLTRSLVHRFADATQDWQDVADGQMGRLLGGYVSGSRYRSAVTETIALVNCDLGPESYARAYIGWLGAIAAEFGVGADEWAAWLDDLERRAAQGRFHFSIQWTYVIAQK